MVIKLQETRDLLVIWVVSSQPVKLGLCIINQTFFLLVINLTQWRKKIKPDLREQQSRSLMFVCVFYFWSTVFISL